MFHVGQRDTTYNEFLAFVLKKKKLRVLTSLAITPGVGIPVFARVEHNRWLADCECAGAEVVDAIDPRFYCLSCMNDANGGRPRPVIFPDDTDDVEDALVVRSDPLTRGYTPAAAVDAVPNLLTRGFLPETTAMLFAENESMGLPTRRTVAERIDAGV